MEGIDTQDDYPLELNEYISGLYPDELQVDHYLNLATASGSRYVFRVVSKGAKNGVVIKFVSGPKALKKAEGKLADTIIELSGILDFKGGSTSTLAGIVITQGAPYEYPYVELKYNEFLDELDSEQLRVGDHIYFGTEDGQTYIAKIINVDGKMPLIRFVAGRNSLVGSEGYLKIKNLIIGMKFRNTVKSTMPIQTMFVLPDMDAHMLDILDKECEIQELEYDTEIESFYTSQLQDGDFVHIETTSKNNSTYVIEFNNNAIQIAGGKNYFIGETGEFSTGKINKGHRLKSTIALTSPIQSIRITKTYEPEDYIEIDVLRKNLEARQLAATNYPINSMTNPMIWVKVAASGVHKLEILDVLKLDPNELTRIETLKTAWENFQVKSINDHQNALPHVRREWLERFKILKRQYENLIKKLKKINTILEEE